MAEGGQENDADNPFSFKHFVVKKDTSKTDAETSSNHEDIDIFEDTKTRQPKKRDKQRQIVVVDDVDDTKPKQKKKGKTENPFSFKKFLSGSSGGTSSLKSKQSCDNNDPSVVQGTRTTNKSDRVGVSSLNSDLPDFVQDHYSDILGSNSSPRSLELPDFTLPGNNASDKSGTERLSGATGRKRFSNASSELQQGRNREQGSGSFCSHNDSDDFDEFSDNETDKDRRVGVVSKLPDFLSDAAIASSKAPAVVPAVNGVGGVPARVDGDTLTELNRLREENEELRKQLDELKKTTSEAKSVTELRQQLVEQQKKEAEETAAMEKAMEQVEQNLSSTTKRAVLAENTVSRLKQELKTLQVEMKSLRAENTALKSGDQFVVDLKERTTYVAEQLSSATKTAESSLKQLLSGVDNLKLLSQVLNSIDKISEDQTSGNHSNTQPPQDGS